MSFLLCNLKKSQKSILAEKMKSSNLNFMELAKLSNFVVHTMLVSQLNLSTISLTYVKKQMIWINNSTLLKSLDDFKKWDQDFFCICMCI